MLRNPFCIPFPLEDGVEMFSEAVLAPKHTSGSSTLSGFAIGGLTQASMRSRYTVKPTRESKSAGGLPFASENNAIPTSGGPYRDPKKTNPSSPSNRAKLTSGASRKDGGKEVSSLVLNEDMVKIRQAELVILKEEEKFGRLGRDPQGILHPIDQADARTVAYEMEKDYRKPITEGSNSRNELVNLHSAKGGVGVVPQPWRPEEVDAEFFKQSDRLENTDKSVVAKTRGKSNVGGLLNPLEARGAETRAHLPLKPTIGANMEFMNLRKKKTIGDRLAEITKLKESIKQQRLALERERIRSNQRKMKSGTANSTRHLSTAGGRRNKLGTATNGSAPSTPMTPGTKNIAQAFGFNMGGGD
ncbi:MAG: hypothetical protein VXZ58_04065, partial [Actinomycetota bacterium]|nr:hypothetical protein [Actinomycetota bacterium]